MKASLPEPLLAPSPVTIRTAVRAVRRHSAEPVRPSSAARRRVQAAKTNSKTKRKSRVFRAAFINAAPVVLLSRGRVGALPTTGTETGDQ
jgi:hypothetical protein